jgi:hypothetical protein
LAISTEISPFAWLARATGELGTGAGSRAAQWIRARQLLQLRLRMRLAPTRDERASIERILTLIDEEQENGIGGQPAVAPAPTRA